MNTIEFAVEDGVPYAIDFLNPAPDFERDRITAFYFDHVVEKMAKLVIDRALQRQRREFLAALGRDARHRRGSGFTGCSCAHKDRRERPRENAPARGIGAKSA